MFIRDHREEFPISLMCEVIGVSRGGYYSWLRRPESKRGIEDRKLKTEIRSTHAESKRIYGSPKIYEELKDRGIRCSLKRVTRLMREDGLYAKTTKKFKATTNSRHIFCHESNVILMREAFQNVIMRHSFTIDAFVLLPEHLHCIWTLPEDDNDFSTRWRQYPPSLDERGLGGG